MIFLPLLAAALLGQGSPDFAQTWNKIDHAIRDDYYARQTRSAEMDERLKKYAPFAEAARSKKEFEDIVNRMIAEFKDSHFQFYTDEDQGYYVMDGFSKNPASMPEMGAWFAKDGDLFKVQMVLEGTPAQEADLRKGDIVTLADGKPFSPVDSLAPDVGRTVILQIIRGSQSLEKRISVKSEPALDMFLDATGDSARVIALGKKKIGYVHLWTQAQQRFAAKLASIVYNKFANTDAVILDLRDGFGGRPEGYGDPFFRPEAWLDWKAGPTKIHQLFGYARPLVVLINGGSRSAKEVLSYVFKKSRRATLIGSNTAGNVLGTSPRRINVWSIVEIPFMEVYADGVRLEGKGVAPDIAVPQEFDSNGKDLFLDRALEFLSKNP